MRGIIYSLIASSLLISSMIAKNISVDENMLKELLKRVKKLENENQIIKQQLKRHNDKIRNTELKISNNINALDELEDSIEKVETATLTDKINFSFYYKTRLDNYSKKLADGSTKKDRNVWSNKLMLNMHSKITDNMKFTGRLSMQKAWASSGAHFWNYFDSMQGRTNDSDSRLWVERAYVDWLLNRDGIIPTVLTIGRQPSSDGMSYNLSEDGVRKSTYSALTFDGAADGITATFNISKYIPNSTIRLAYGKGYQGTENPLMADTPSLDDTDVAGLIFESKLPKSIANDSVFQVGYVAIRNMIGDYSDLMIANGTNNANIGDMDILGAMVELHHIKNSKWDGFFHIAYNRAKPNGNTVCLDINQNGICDRGETMGLLSSTSTTEDKSGNAFWIGTRYNLDNGQKVGFEYNHGSKYWIAMTQGAGDPYNKLATRGDAYDLYYIYPISRYSHLKIGGIYIDYKYTGSSWHVGEPLKISDLPLVYRSRVVDKLIDLYLQFIVNF